MRTTITPITTTTTYKTRTTTVVSPPITSSVNTTTTRLSTSTTTSRLTSTSTSLFSNNAINSTCPNGFVGNNCEDECGLTFYTQNQKIVGGSVAVAYSWPSQVYIKISYIGTFYLTDYGVNVTQNISFACGGVLIDRETVLTAAHCILDKISFEYKYQYFSFKIKIDPTMYTVYLGLYDTKTINNNNISPAVKMSIKNVIKVIF